MFYECQTHSLIGVVHKKAKEKATRKNPTLLEEKQFFLFLWEGKGLQMKPHYQFITEHITGSNRITILLLGQGLGKVCSF